MVINCMENLDTNSCKPLNMQLIGMIEEILNQNTEQIKDIFNSEITSIQNKVIPSKENYIKRLNLLLEKTIQINKKNLKEKLGLIIHDIYTKLDNNTKKGIPRKQVVAIKLTSPVEKAEVFFNTYQTNIIKKIFKRIPCLDPEAYLMYLAEIKLNSTEKSFSKRLADMWKKNLSRISFFFPNEERITKKYTKDIMS